MEPLKPGSRVGPYEIVSVLGAGGMGVVYRAHDPRLKRDVALKMLPEGGDRKRFEHEARAVAALDHPNVVSIYDVGEGYFVEELVEGRTLRKAELARGELAEVFAQAADGLAAAHAAGLTHRDLKPENVMVTREGRVKVLDFGLARGSGVLSPTDSTRTEPGLVAGTPAYMAPEQARGEEVDARTDIFAFGVMLFEKLSGKRAFVRDTAAETLTAVLKEELEPLPETTPAVLRAIVERCLKKERTLRFQSAADLAFALRAAATGSAAGVRAVKARRMPWAMVAGAILLVVAAWFAAARWGREAREELRFVQLTQQEGDFRNLSLAPDGKSFIFSADTAGNRDIYSQRVGGRNAVNLTADYAGTDHQAALSPDGQRIAFRSDRDGGGIFVMGASGESVKRVTGAGYMPCWSPDGKEIAYTTVDFDVPWDRAARGVIEIVNLETGRRSKAAEADAVQPSWSPNGHRIAFWGLGGGGQRDIFTVDAKGGEREAVTSDAPVDWNPVWSPDGKYLYFLSDRGGTKNAWRMRIDERSGKTQGQPVQVTLPANPVSQLVFAGKAGGMGFVARADRQNLFRLALKPGTVDAAGKTDQFTWGGPVYFLMDVTPDGELLAFSSSGREDLFVLDLRKNKLVQLTDDDYRDRGPAWSADLRTLYFYSGRSGSYQLWSISPDGSGLKQLSNLESGVTRPVPSAAGNQVAYSDSSGSGSAAHVAELGADGIRNPRRLNLPFSGQGQFSADGRRMLSRLWTTGFPTTSRVDIYDFEKDSSITLGECGAILPFWALDERYVVAATPDGRGLMAFEVATRKSKVITDFSPQRVDLISFASRQHAIYVALSTLQSSIWLAERK